MSVNKREDETTAASERLRLYGAWVIGLVCGAVVTLTILGLTGAIR